MGFDFSDIFSRHICSTVAETIGVTNNAAILARKNVQKTTFEAAEMMLGPWNQQRGRYLKYITVEMRRVILVAWFLWSALELTPYNHLYQNHNQHYNPRYALNKLI